ncbi:tRNA intron endonuclease [Xylariomycetidae sp. FL0641]|nr:tRNA intron endonuclease [Xylariomycetidae sp. FL0641]
MASSTDAPLVRISKIAGRYLVFDIDDVMYLRRNHNICSVYVGTIPQNPQQNVFMGLPVELMPEEAQVLVNKKVACIVDDATFHPARLASMDDATRRTYLQSLKDEGRRAHMAAIAEKEELFKAKTKQLKAKKKNKQPQRDPSTDMPKDEPDDEDTSLFDASPLNQNPIHPPKTEAEVEPFAVTHTTSSSLLPDSSSPSTDAAPLENLPASYPLYAHLQDKGYYMMPGLRFGCHYNVYPGDPLRFHSHFQATHVAWDQEINMLDIVGGGRLGTNVKKGYLLGGAVADANAGGGESGSEGDGSTKAPPVRTFCIEWAGM